MNDETMGMAPGHLEVLVPLAVALAILATLGIALLGGSWVSSRTTVVVVNGPVQVLNGGFSHNALGWAPVGSATLLWSPGHGGSLALGSSTPTAQSGAAAPAGILVVGRVVDKAVYRVRAQLRLAQAHVRNVRLAVVGCIGGASDAARSPDLSARLSTSTWTTVAFDARLDVATCPAMVPTLQITAVGQGPTLLVDDVSLAPR